MDIDLKTLKMPVGFKITGERNSNSFVVGKAGDINGDGFADIIIGARNIGDGGTSYIIFGSSREFTDINLSTLKMPIGFKIFGEEGDESGNSVSGVGDLNKDGYDDIIIGAPIAYRFAHDFDGKVYVIFGRAKGFSDINLSTLKMPTGFRILGENKDDHCGDSVKNAGDINKDGYSDIIIGAPWALNNTGKSYVIFGKASGFSDINLKALSMPVGFRIIGENKGDRCGRSVSGAGDLNKDGYDDIIIGTPEALNNTGKSYVIFGKANGFTDVELRKLTNVQGFRIIGEMEDDDSGYSVSGAGDVNKDGYADIIIGAVDGGRNPVTAPGKSYVIFGNGIGFSDISLNKLSMPEGFKILGEEGSEDGIGWSVSGAGDVNGDGYADVVIGAPEASGDSRGKSYVIFGKSRGFSDIKLSVLNMPVGFRVLGESPKDMSGRSVSSAGDINKDGYDDFIIGSNNKCYIIFGASTSDSEQNSSKKISEYFIEIGLPIIGGLSLFTIGCIAYSRYKSKQEHILINNGVVDATVYTALAGATAVPGADARSIEEESGNDVFNRDYDENMELQWSGEISSNIDC